MTRVLIVEDDIEGADAIRQYLEFHGFQVGVALSGEAAMEKVQGDGHYDVVVTDLQLPGIRGEDLAQRLLDGLSDPPKLIALSGEHGFLGQEPFDVRLPKPCRPRALVEAIRGLMNRP